MGTFQLEPYCVLVEGARKGAVYNLKAGKVYSVNEEGKQTLAGRREDSEFWQKLVSLGLAYFGAPKPSLEISEIKRTLGFAWLELTSDCNLRCLHCYGSFGEPAKRIESLDWGGVLEQLFACGCRRIQFIGGEPLLCHELKLLVLAAKELGFKFVEIFTNGTLLDDSWARFLKQAGVSLAISLYSTDPVVHDEITQVKGSHARTISALRLAKDLDIPVRVATIAMRQNQATLEQTCAFVKSCGFRTRGPDVIRPTGRGCEQGLVPDQETLNRYAMMSKPNFRTSARSFALSCGYNNCWFGKLAIGADGQVFPCIFARDLSVSDLSKQTLGEVLDSQRLNELWGMTLDKVEVCGGCEYRYCCRNCRPLSLATYSDLYARNPRCAYNPREGSWGVAR